MRPTEEQMSIMARRRAKQLAHDQERAIKGPTLPPTEPGPHGSTLCFRYSDKKCQKRRMHRKHGNRAKVALTEMEAQNMVLTENGGNAYRCPSWLNHWHYTSHVIVDPEIYLKNRRGLAA